MDAFRFFISLLFTHNVYLPMFCCTITAQQLLSHTSTRICASTETLRLSRLPVDGFLSSALSSSLLIRMLRWFVSVSLSLLLRNLKHPTYLYPSTPNEQILHSTTGVWTELCSSPTSAPIFRFRISPACNLKGRASRTHCSASVPTNSDHISVCAISCNTFICICFLFLES